MATKAEQLWNEFKQNNIVPTTSTTQTSTGNSGLDAWNAFKTENGLSQQQTQYKPETFSNFITGTQKLAEQIGMNDFRSATNSYNALQNQRKIVGDYIAQNWTDMDSDVYSDWREFLSLFDELGASVQDHQNKLNFDFDANQAEVESLNRILNEYDILSRTMTDERGTARLAELQEQYGSKNAIEAAIAALETSANRARYYQQGYALGDVADPTSANYDPAFAQESQYKPNNDTLSQYINNPTFRDEYQDLLRRTELTNDNALWRDLTGFLGVNFDRDNYGDKGYDLMTENEVDLYNYYYNTGGAEAADRYLESIQETLNSRAGYERFQEMEGSALAEILFSPEVGTRQFVDNTASFADAVASHWGNGSEYIPASSTQFAAAYAREDLADVGPKIFGSSLGQAAFDTGTTTFNMMPSILASYAMNMIAPGSGAYVGGALMGMSAAGGAYQEALNQGYTNEQARLYGYAIGASEFATSAILGGISAVGGQVSGHVIGNALSKVDSGIWRAVGKLGGSFLSEGTEEGLQEIFTPMIQRAILHQDNSVDWDAVGYSYLLGGLTALILEGPTTAYNEGNIYRTGRNLIDAGITAQRVAEVGRSLSESEATELAERMLANPEKYADDAYSVGRLFREVGAHLGEQNIIDITNELVRNGLDEDLARKNAEVMAYVIDGGELSESDIAVLEANDVLADAVKKAVIDPNASWNVRTREYMNMLNSLEGKTETAQPAVKTAEEAQPVAEAPAMEAPEAAQPVSEAAAEAQAIRISDKTPVEAQGVSAVRNGKVTVQLKDGTQVDASDLSFKNENEARLYDTLGQMGKNLTASAANTLIKGFEAVRNDETAAHNYVMGITEAFNYGKQGIPMRELSETEYASTLNPGQQQYAWNRGQDVLGMTVGKREAIKRQTVAAAQEIIRSGKAVGTAREGKVELRAGITEAELNSKQKLVYDLANRIAPGMKLNVKVYAGETTGWGHYDPKNDEVYLNLNANNKNRQTMMAHALGHELVHRAKLGSPAKYQAFTAFLMREYSKRGVSVDDMIEQQMQAAKDSGFELTEEEAYDEVVCDACQTMLLDTDAGKKLAMFGAQSQQNKSILDDIRNWINDFMDKVRAYFAGVESDSMAAREFAKFDENVKQILADMYVDMSVDAGESLSVIQQAFGKNTLVETNIDGEFTVASNGDGSKKLFNLTTWENGGRATLEATLIREGFTQKEVEAALTIMDEKQKMVMDIANELNDNGDLAFPEQGRINEATLTTDIKTGKSVMSALVTNGDYPINIDLLMVCKKRKAYQRVINRLCDTGMIEQATIDAMAIAQINKILGKHGFETACIGCFVESRRLRIQEWAETIVEEWNAEVRKRNPDAKAFGFGKGEHKLTQDEIIKLDYELRKGGKKNKQGNLNLGRGNAVTRMGRLLDKVPSLQKTLSVNDLITPDGLAALRAMDGNLFSMVKSRYGSNSPKFVQEFNPYNHEIAMYGKPPKGYKNLRDYLYAIGGARMQSFSDFIVENWFDYCQIVADLSARKLPMHTYTKEIALVKLFGMTGIKINMSLIPDIDRSMGREYAGLTRNAKGELELIWADKDRNKATGGKSYMQSINFADAIALQNDPRYSANVGTIAIGVSDIQIRMMLADPRVRMVIPYHSSGMNPVFAKMMGSDFYRDYTDYQNTTVKQLYNSEGQPVSLNLEKKQTEKLTGGFMWNKVLQETGDARAAAEAYKDWCADASKHTVNIDGKTYIAELNPKFADFKGETNYYKLLTDFNPYDCITEEAAPQGDVQQIFPQDFEKILRGELTAQEEHRQKQEKNHEFDKAMEEIEDYLKSHKTSKQLHEAGMKQKVPVRNTQYRKPAYTVWDVDDALSDALDHSDAKDDNVIRVGEVPRFITDMIGIGGDFYIYRNHAYENMVSEKQAIQDKRPTMRKDKKIHFHNLGKQRMAEAIMSLENPILSVADSTDKENPKVVMVLPVNGDNDAPLYAALSFYENKPINGSFVKKPHIVLTIAERGVTSDGVHRGYDEIISEAVKKGRLLSVDKEKMRAYMPVIADLTRVGNIADSTLKENITQFRKEINTFREKNKINYKTPTNQEVSNRTLLEKAAEDPNMHEVLKKRIQDYVTNDDAFQAEEAKLNEIREEIRELSLTNNKEDAAHIRELQSEALKTAHRMDTLEGRLRRAEGDKYLGQILKDERAKLTAEQKAQGVKPRRNLQNARAQETSAWLREQRAMRQELTGREADTAVIEREFIRLVKEYEKQGTKDAARYDSLKARMEKKVAEQKADKQIWQREFKRLLREYDAADRQIARLEQRVERQKARASEKVENRQKAAVREKILNLRDRMRKSLLSPTERMYVPVNLVNAMIDVCNLINDDTELYKKDGSINKSQQNRLRMREKLQNLREEYEKLRVPSDPVYQGEFDEMVYNYLGELRDRFNGRNVKEMSLDELQEMYEYLKGIEETLADAKQLIGWTDAGTVYEAADSIVSEQNAITAKRKGKDRSHAQRVKDANYNLTLSPMRNVERMAGYDQNSYLYQFFRRFEQGIRKKNRFIMDAHKAFAELTVIKDYDKTLYEAVGKKEYTDENGKKFGVSKMQMMQAILSWERETANEMNHIQGLGITFADLKRMEKGKMRDAVSSEYSHRIPAAEAVELIADFQKQLKDDKWVQNYMAEARKFFNETAKNAINETTIALKHRIVATDKSYIPFEVDKNFIVNEISAENDIQETINSYGMLKDIKKGASQPLIVTGLNNVLERHIEKVANVYGLAVEVRNFNKVWNAKSDAAGVTRTVKGAVEKNWGAGGVKMITQAVQDIQGPRTRSDNALYKKIKSNYINATFLLNFSVVAKQIGSLFSSTSMLRWRGPVRMLFNLGSTMLHHKKIAAEVDKYTATAWMRKQGISDAELDNFMTEGKHGLVRRLYDKLPDAVHPEKYIAFMDYSVALSLWKYAKIDTQKRTKLEGEELLRETAKFYDDLVEQTQSMADVLHRPEAQKKEGVIAESFGLFKTDLYQMAGQLQNAAGRFGANKTKTNAKSVTKTVTAIAGSALWAQLMTSMFALLRYKVNHYRDEEDKDLTVESWLKRQKFSIAADLMGYLFPLFGSELAGIFEKFAYGESDVLVDNLALTAINDLSELAFEVAASIKDGEMPDTEDLLNLATKSLQLLGVPANNIMRAYNALRLHGRDFLNGKLFSFEAGIDRTPTEHIYRVMDAINDGDTAEAVELFEYAVEEGAKERAENGIFGTDEIKQSESALRDRVGEMYREGDISATMARTLLMECFDLDRDEVDLMLAKWDFKMEYGYSWSDKGDAYLNHDISARDLRELLIEIDGKTEEEADDYIKALDFEMEYGWAYDSRVTEYVKGNVTDSELRMALINYGGMSIEEADTYMKAYRWIKNNPEYDLTVNRVLTYTAPVKNLGISIEQAGIDANVFNDYADLRADCEGIDANGDGKADSGTVKDQVIPIIDSLPLTPEQKDVLYIQNGWAQSGLRKTPWH